MEQGGQKGFPIRSLTGISTGEVEVAVGDPHLPDGYVRGSPLGSGHLSIPPLCLRARRVLGPPHFFSAAPTGLWHVPLPQDW